MERNQATFVDMDGVLVNFIEGIKDLFDCHDITFKDYDISGTLGMTPSSFWGVIDKATDNDGFWENLNPLPDGKKLLRELEKITPNIYILSSPPINPLAAAQKISWIYKHLSSSYRRRFIITPNKDLLALPNRILIDDWEINCRNWESGGGCSILYKSEYNQNGLGWEQAVDVVKTKLDD